jgi:tetratricopeptide (TPR) repeat protein
MAHLDPRNPANAAALRSIETQQKIRQSTLQLNDQLADLVRWEKTIKRKDAELVQEGRAARLQAVPVRGGAKGNANTVRTRTGGGARSKPLEELQREAAALAAAAADAASDAAASGGGGGGGVKAGRGGSTAADHTYDKGYQKWEKFDVDKAEAEVEVEDISRGEADGGSGAAAAAASGDGKVAPHVVTGDRPDGPVFVARTQAPVRSGPTDISEIFEVERKNGNAHFARGEFADAIRCYTKCIGLDSRNAVVYSNRAAAFLKVRLRVSLVACASD